MSYLLKHRKKIGLVVITLLLAVTLGFVMIVSSKTQDIPDTLTPDLSNVERSQFQARDGSPLSWTKENAWNVQELVPIHSIPAFLISAVLRAEDKRFFEHKGSDFKAISKAIFQNLLKRRIVRGASSISEQVIKILHSRPRTFVSRVLDAIEASRLESKFSKLEILEFYLNQSPYPWNNKGVGSAARDLFNRDLSTLSKKEILALAVMIKAPSKFVPAAASSNKVSKALESSVMRLARLMAKENMLSSEELSEIELSKLEFSRPLLPTRASHFVAYMRKELSRQEKSSAFVRTTIDPMLQNYAQKLLDIRLSTLSTRNVRDGAILIVDNQNLEILAWVTARDGTRDASQIDGVRVPRQPGSALKPFLYALALDRGWTAATLIDDLPLLRPVGLGLKEYRNYSGAFHGPIRLREALANSLNIPALRCGEHIGNEVFFRQLKELGFESLGEAAEHYGEGLALGNGEVSLFELTRAYTVLANHGVYRELKSSPDFQEKNPGSEKRIYSDLSMSIIGDILSDPQARSLEFPSADYSDFRSQTAIKTGTSSDYHDAWAMGYTSRYTVGVWIGNFNREAMSEVTGSSGPMLLLKGLFSYLERSGKSKPLYLDPSLRRVKICRENGRRVCDSQCSVISEWFAPGTEPREDCGINEKETFLKVDPKEKELPTIALPSDNLRLAKDPRIPESLQKFPLTLSSYQNVKKVKWSVDRIFFADQSDLKSKILWPLSRGPHTVSAKVWMKDGKGSFDLEERNFLVK